MAASDEAVCIFCENTVVIGFDGNVLTKRGLDSARKSAEIRGDASLLSRLPVSSSAINGNTHKTCFRDYTNKRRHEQMQRNKSAEDGLQEHDVSLPKLLRSSVDVFNWKSHCFLCDRPAVIDTRHPHRNDTFSARTLPLMKTILEICSSRNDSWGVSVKGRLNTISDLVSAEAVYHRKCYTSFHRSNSAKPGVGKSSSDNAIGRPIDTAMQEAFDRMCESLERADDEVNTLDDLVIKMKLVASGPDHVYSRNS